MFWNNLLTHSLRFWTLVPWLLLASIYSLGLRTAYLLGHLPRCYNDDSPDEWLCNLLWWVDCHFFYALLASPVVVSLLLGLNQRRERRDDWRVHAGLYTLGWAAIFLLLTMDPGGIMDWWMD